MSASESLRILTLQPFYGGSHRLFIDSWIEHSQFEWHLMSLPDRHWKWRMRHSAVEFARQVDQQWHTGRWDAIVCSDMLNLAEFKGLLRTAASELPTMVYFHENQFEYPNVLDQPRDMHFAFTNLTTALSADWVAFNSQYNLDSMLAGIQKWLKIWPDFQPVDCPITIREKSQVLHPGVEMGSLEERSIQAVSTKSPVHIVWAARWEHDKNPQGLLDILNRIDGQVDFRLSVVGQQYSRRPQEFERIQQQFGDRIVHWGYQPSRESYEQVLKDADIVLSTAIHEFFGISVVEAMSFGCIPLLPERLAYPELLAVINHEERREFLYESVEHAASKLISWSNGKLDSGKLLNLFNDIRVRFHWVNRAQALDDCIDDHLFGNRDS